MSRFVRFVIPAIILALWLAHTGSFSAVSAQNCVIPTSGPWPPCATGGGGATPAPAPNGTPCPASGVWPPGCVPAGAIAPVPAPVPAPTQPAPSQPVPAPTPDWNPPDYIPPVTHKLSQIGALPEGTDVVVRVQVVSSGSFRSGYKFGITDNTGRVTMITWHSVYDDCEQCNALNIGSELVLSGVTDSFEGEVQIVPLYGAAVRVTKPSFMPGRLVEIGSLGRYVSQRAKIEGRITQVNRNNYGVELKVDDGTGEEEVFFWNNNWQRIPDSWQLKVGAVIQAAGTVEEWRGQFTVNPPLPYDVVVITPAR